MSRFRLSMGTSFVILAAVACPSRAIAQGAQTAALPNAQLALAQPRVDGMQQMRSEASLLISSGQYGAAAEVYKRLLQVGSNEASDRYWLGESLYHLSNFQQAAIAFEQAIQLNPKFPQAFVRLSETYIALHQKQKAAQTCTNGLNVVTDPYMKEQLSNLLKVAAYEEGRTGRTQQSRSVRMPAES
ncbi:MAG: tetratricopeptide repeat protein [Cyanobacteria bacterium SZAS LIN-5]|nr:tetratricopeptide repeat protein [Cyanobacteria bacterium SZAS LIN-5]